MQMLGNEEFTALGPPLKANTEAMKMARRSRQLNYFH